MADSKKKRTTEKEGMFSGAISALKQGFLPASERADANIKAKTEDGNQYREDMKLPVGERMKKLQKGFFKK